MIPAVRSDLQKMTRAQLEAECVRLREHVALYQEIEAERERAATRGRRPVVTILQEARHV